MLHHYFKEQLTIIVYNNTNLNAAEVGVEAKLKTVTKLVIKRSQNEIEAQNSLISPVTIYLPYITKNPKG
jgi:hypothetical protein